MNWYWLYLQAQERASQRRSEARTNRLARLFDRARAAEAIRSDDQTTGLSGLIDRLATR